MQSFFNLPASIKYSTNKYPSWRYVRDGLLRNLDKVKSYYHDRPMAVKSNHYISKLLNSINIPFSLPVERFVDIADAKVWNISMAFKMNSPVYRGSIFRGGFYSSDGPEIYVSVTDYFDLYEQQNNWQNIQAVYPIHHNKTSLGLLLPNGRDYEPTAGPSIIAINIPLLALQYRCFLKDQIRQHGNSFSEMLTTSHFVHMYVLPNMLDKHLDIALFNRFKNQILGGQMEKVNKTHPFALPDYESRVDDTYAEVIQDFSNSTKPFKQALMTIPAVVEEDMMGVLVLPDNAPTRQSIWVEVLARIDALAVLTQIGTDGSIQANRGDINYFIRQFKHFRSDALLETYLPRDLYDEVMLVIKLLEEHWGSPYSR